MCADCSGDHGGVLLGDAVKERRPGVPAQAPQAVPHPGGFGSRSQGGIAAAGQGLGVWVTAWSRRPGLPPPHPGHSELPGALTGAETRRLWRQETPDPALWFLQQLLVQWALQRKEDCLRRLPADSLPPIVGQNQARVRPYTDPGQGTAANGLDNRDLLLEAQGSPYVHALGFEQRVVRGTCGG